MQKTNTDKLPTLAAAIRPAIRYLFVNLPPSDDDGEVDCDQSQTELETALQHPLAEHGFPGEDWADCAAAQTIVVALGLIALNDAIETLETPEERAERLESDSSETAAYVAADLLNRRDGRPCDVPFPSSASGYYAMLDRHDRIDRGSARDL